jgi:hypothetical protein
MVSLNHDTGHRQLQNGSLDRLLKRGWQWHRQTIEIMRCHQTTDFPRKITTTMHDGQGGYMRADLEERIDQGIG